MAGISAADSSSTAPASRAPVGGQTAVAAPGTVAITPQNALALKHAFLKAYFTDGQDPSAHDVLVRYAVAAGLDADQAREVLTSGRYITMWRKEPDGKWKVVLDAGANEPPAAGDCCKLPGH